MTDIFCFVDGDDATFPVTFNAAQTVGRLKEAIRTAKSPKLDDIAADELKLYRIEIEIEKARYKKTRIDELNRLFQNLDVDTALDEEQQLSESYEDAPLGKVCYIIV